MPATRRVVFRSSGPGSGNRRRWLSQIHARTLPTSRRNFPLIIRRDQPGLALHRELDPAHAGRLNQWPRKRYGIPISRALHLGRRMCATLRRREFFSQIAEHGLLVRKLAGGPDPINQRSNAKLELVGTNPSQHKKCKSDWKSRHQQEDMIKRTAFSQNATRR